MNENRTHPVNRLIKQIILRLEQKPLVANQHAETWEVFVLRFRVARAVNQSLVHIILALSRLEYLFNEILIGVLRKMAKRRPGIEDHDTDIALVKNFAYTIASQLDFPMNIRSDWEPLDARILITVFSR